MRLSRGTWLVVFVACLQMAVTFTAFSVRRGRGEERFLEQGMGMGMGMGDSQASSGHLQMSGAVRVPRWAAEKVTDDNGCLRLHEVFTSTPPRIQWAATRKTHLIIPEHKPSGWTPVSPLEFDCPALHWYNKPEISRVSVRDNNLVVRAEEQSEFWQDGNEMELSHDAGHFLHIEHKQSAGETIILRGRFGLHTKHRGDKVGLMVRRGASAWASVALTGGARGEVILSSVVTNHGHSDFASLPCDADCEGEVSLRISITHNDLLLEANFSPEEEPRLWRTLRVARLYDLGEEKDTHEVSVGTFISATNEGM